MKRRTVLLIVLILYIAIGLGGIVYYVAVPRPVKDALVTAKAPDEDEMDAEEEDLNDEDLDDESIDEDDTDETDTTEEGSNEDTSIDDSSISDNDVVSNNEIANDSDGDTSITTGNSVDSATVSDNSINDDKASSSDSVGSSNTANSETASGKTVTVTIGKGRLNVRIKPDKSAIILLSLPNGETATLLSEEGDWAKISYNGKEGYVSKDFITIEE